MTADKLTMARLNRVWLTPEHCNLDDFIAEITCQTLASDYPYAMAIEKNIPIYDSAAIQILAATPDGRKTIMAEWAEAMLTGPGVVVFKNAMPEHDVIDAASARFNAMIAEQHATQTGGGDHFAKAGANDRVWNALEKLCLADPATFARYYANDMIALVAQCWLGLGYQVTSQLNVVNPGGEAQSAHRDYHMGFQTAAEISTYPSHVHGLSPVLTLQGAVAHCDMPLESGPTLYLPYSQRFLPGYFAYRKPEFRAYFDAHHVQLPLNKGDMAFFNPALFHGAGHNRTSHIKRMANLLQISSAYGRAMESMDRNAMSIALYPALADLAKDGGLSAQSQTNAMAACAEGYAFPTNLDRDPPLGGLAPATPQAIMAKALAEGWPPAQFAEALTQNHWRRLTR
jgi:ectoine hydroxylase-related dioxygenase (phytanoyl-CoA dioxygenase family)